MVSSMSTSAIGFSPSGVPFLLSITFLGFLCFAFYLYLLLLLYMIKKITLYRILYILVVCSVFACLYGIHISNQTQDALYCVKLYFQLTVATKTPSPLPLEVENFFWTVYILCALTL